MEHSRYLVQFKTRFSDWKTEASFDTLAQAEEFVDRFHVSFRIRIVDQYENFKVVYERKEL